MQKTETGYNKDLCVCVTLTSAVRRLSPNGAKRLEVDVGTVVSTRDGLWWCFR
jgi:hypothetical protein